MDPPPRKKKAAEGENGAAVAVPLKEAPGEPMARPSNSKDEVPISLKRLVDARRGEIMVFEETVRKTSGGTGGGAGKHRRAHQLLPRHLRRRAMSYNPYLVPFRLREMAIKQCENTVAPKGRFKMVPKPTGQNGAKTASGSTSSDQSQMLAKPKRFWRRRRPVRRMGGTEQTGFWLETHLWHAKRAQMVPYAGYKVAIQMSNRARRPAWRSARSGVVCLDSSFVKAISISGSSAAISSLLAKLHLNASFHLIDFNLRKLHGVFLHKPAQNSTSKTSFIPMAPARIHGRKISDSKYQFLLWIDPHAIKEVETVLKELGGKDVCVELFGALQNRFEIIGPKASSVLQKILDPMDSNVKDALKKYLVNRPKTIPAGTTLAFEVRDPRMIRYARRLAPPQPTTNSKPSSQFPSLVDLMNSLVLHGSASTDGLASHSSLDSCPLFNSTNPRDFACKFHDHQTQDPQTMHSVSQESKAWILLQRFEDGGDEHEGWYLSVPATWGKVFWRCLVRPGGVRPIGLRERQDLDFESGRPRFPQDFPGCLSYTKYINELSENLKEAWLRRPPQKRLNYAKQGISSPFKVDLLALWQRCAGHYLPSEFIGPEPIIYLSYSFGNSSIPSKPVSELKPTWTKTSNNSYALRLPLVPVLITLDDGGTTMKYNAHIYEMDAKKTGSESIGFVTSGAFSYSRGKCTAIAFIATHLLHRSGQKILVRNVTSIEYHIASWEHIASIYG